MSFSTRFLRTTLTTALLCAVLTVSAAALNYGSGVVDASALHLRESANTGARILTTLVKGTEVVVLENQKDGWYKVDLDGTVGYMSADYLSVTPSTYTGTLNTDGFSLNLRSGPGTNYSKVESIPSGAALIITGIEDGWYQTSYNGVKGYVSSDYVKLNDAAAEETPPAETPVKTNLGTGTPNTNGISLNMRSGPGTNYDMIDSIPFGATLTITDAVNGWYKTSYNGTEGYVSSDYITLDAAPEPEPSTGTLNTDGASLNLRSGPGTNFDKLTTIPADAVLTITGNEDGWYKVSYGGAAGYVSSDYVVLSTASNGSSSQTTSSTNKGTTSNSSTSSSSNSNSSSTSANSGSTSSSSGLGSQIVSYAKQFLGIPYVYGANGPSAYDCSSFTQTVFKHFGYTLNRSAAGQYKNGTAIELSQVKPGDILLWRSYGSSKTATHVGIYIGNNMYIHASSSGGCITINDMSYGSNARYLVGVRRIIA